MLKTGSMSGPVYQVLYEATQFQVEHAGAQARPAEKSGFVGRRSRLARAWGGMRVVVSPASLIDPSNIPNHWIQLTTGVVTMLVIRNLQSGLKNLRGGDNDALA